MKHVKDDCLYCMRHLIRKREILKLSAYVKEIKQTEPQQKTKGLDEIFWD